MAITMCAVCGEYDGKILRCSRCHSREYCGKDCQTQDWPTHKKSCKRQNFILRVDLCPSYLTNPRVTRTLSCPANASFADLHEALQIAFGWKDCHLHEFEVLNHSESMGNKFSASSRATLLRISPSNILEEAQDDQNKCSSETLLNQILDGELTRGKTILYRYDFGDDWEHVMVCGGRADPTENFELLGGEGHGCAEDVGGSYGWIKLIEAYDSNNPTKDQRETMDWFEEEAHNKDSYGLRGAAKYTWDKEKLNTALKELNTSALSGDASSILLISLGKEFWFDGMYADMIAKLRTKATVREVTDSMSAMKHVKKSIENYSTIIVTDAVFMQPIYHAINRELIGYVKSGGKVIFGFMVPNLAEPPTFEKFFSSSGWGLNWKFGTYTRDTYKVNSQAHLTGLCQATLKSYSMKALSLQNAKPQDRVYAGPDGARDQSPAIFAKYERSGAKQGYVGWLGDVNTEEGTTTLLLAMCGF
ncbi:hypothetical protein ABEW05_005901 [Botrytis cinerea]